MKRDCDFRPRQLESGHSELFFLQSKDNKMILVGAACGLMMN